MSRAFVNDDAAESAPVIPSRPELPAGVPNYVTPAGLRLLREELAELEAEKAAINAKKKLSEADRRRELAIVNGRTAQLRERIAVAKLVDPSRMDPGQVRFGAHVTVRSDDGTEKTIQIVGVDEAYNRPDRVAFLAPMARAFMGAKVGQLVSVRTPEGEETLEVTGIAYGDRS